MDKNIFTEEDVQKLLETQRGNCFVAVLTELNNRSKNYDDNEKISSTCVNAPEPGGGSWKSKKTDTVTVSKKEYDNLMDDSIKLSALEGAGVDNWGGYDQAMEMYDEMKAEEE